MDGFNLNFVRRMWGIIGEEFISIVLHFFATAEMPSNVNLTWVFLIPKFEGAVEIKDFRPISMV